MLMDAAERSRKATSRQRVNVTWMAAGCMLALSAGCTDEDVSYTTTGGAAAGPGGMNGETTGTTMGQSTTGGAPGAGGSGSWCDAEKVLEARCQLCHDSEPAYGAPMPLVQHGDFQEVAVDGRPLAQVVSERLHSTEAPMPPLAQGALTPAELAALDSWLAAGAPPPPAEGCQPPATTGGNVNGTTGGDAAVGPGMDGGTASVDGGSDEMAWPEECEEFYELRASENGEPYVVPANSEERRSFEIPVPWQGQVYALALKPLTNNKRVVHHWILYEGAFSMVTSWSPGKEFETFKDGVGVYLPSSGNLRLEMHYYNLNNDQAEPDNSGVEVCVTRSPVEHIATTHMFSGPATVRPQRRVENVGECTVSTSEPVHLITSSPHMHSYGVHAKFEVLRTDGSVEMLHDTPFDWEDQSIKPIDVELHDGDVVRTTCIYQNDTDQTISFGEDSADEMCFNFARYYPRGALTCTGGLFGGIF